MEQKGGFEKKLYTPRDIEGNPNREQLKQLREVEEYLRGKYFNDKEKASGRKLVGLAPFGSVMSGYSTESSDIDAIILYDGPRQPLEDIRKEFLVIRDDVSKKFNAPGKKYVQTQARNLNPEGIFDEVEEGGSESGFFVGAIADMSRMVTGEEINNYRNLYRKKLKSLPYNIQERIIDTAIDEFIMDQEATSALKFVKRTRSIEKPIDADIAEVLEKRRAIWKKRLESLWLK